LIVVLILDKLAVFMPSSSSARLPERGPGRCGDGDRWPGWESVGGRCETQSWTRRETSGLSARLSVLRLEGGVVMMIVGVEEYGVEAR
jgi:hypothetical protein